MPFKRRIDKTREQPITSRAIEIFDQMRRCGGQRWWDLHEELSTELRCRPWQFPCIEHPATRNPYPPGSAAHLSWHPDHEAQDLWKALADASREARAARDGGLPPAGVISRRR